MAYYDNLCNAEMHPLRKAYAAFEMDKISCITTMRTNESMYKLYVESKERLERLKVEQQELLKIMASDLTGDLVVSILKDNNE